MSEPARSTPPIDAGTRTAPGPLRDWLAAMKTHSPAETRSEPRAPEMSPESKGARPAEASLVAADRRAGRAAERDGREDADVSELMAENLMLKAKLRLEADRQDELQAILAQEIRALREHIREEMGSLEDLRAEQEEVRAEREALKAERARLLAECEAMRARTRPGARRARRPAHRAVTRWRVSATRCARSATCGARGPRRWPSRCSRCRSAKRAGLRRDPRKAEGPPEWVALPLPNRRVRRNCPEIGSLTRLRATRRRRRSRSGKPRHTADDNETLDHLLSFVAGEAKVGGRRRTCEAPRLRPFVLPRCRASPLRAPGV